MDERLIEAIDAFPLVSSEEELNQFFQVFPELRLEENKEFLKFLILIAQDKIMHAGQKFELLKQQYVETGNLQNLTEALSILDKILQNPVLKTMDTEFGLNIRTDYSEICLRLYWAEGSLNHLNTAINIANDAIDQTQDLSNLPSRLSNLSLGLKERYSHFGVIEDLETSINKLSYAIEITKKYPNKSCNLPVLYNNYGEALRAHYSRLNNLNDLEESIKALRSAVVNTPENKRNDLPERLQNLGVALIDYYLHSRQIIFLEEGIEKIKHAIEIANEDKKFIVPFIHNSLGHGLLQLYFYSSEIDVLETAIKQFEYAVEKSSNSPQLAQYLCNLGSAYSNKPNYMQEGVDNFRKAIAIGKKYSLEECLRAACNWLNWAFKRNSWAEIEEAYPSLQKTSKQLVEKQLLREHQEAFIQDTQGIAVKVAYARIQTGQLEGAVEALEQGVARLLSSALARSNADLAQLKQDNIKLHAHYQEALQAVNIAQRVYQNAPEHLREKAQSEWQTAEKQFNASLANIRQLQGHENFLLIVTDINTVKESSQQQPLIYIFFTEKGGYALNVFQGQIQAIALPELTNETALEKIISYFEGYSKRGETWFNAIETITAWLYQTVMQPILQNIPTDSQITFIPIGVLNLLPLHAAFYTTTDNKRRYVLDDYTISYAPNALSLQTARKRAQIPVQKLLAIENPTEDLIACSVEIEVLKKYFEKHDIFTHEKATREAVKNALKNDYSVLHFSCHGEANSNNPLETSLIMTDYEKLTVQDFLDSQLNARLVSLSACETGIIGTKQLEEVIGLPSSLLQAGVACVISSLWSVNQYATAFLMIKFYEYFKHDNDKPVIALRKAQHWLRNLRKREILKLSKSYRSDIESSIELSVAEYLYPSDTPYAHPYYWAAFYVTGE